MNVYKAYFRRSLGGRFKADESTISVVHAGVIAKTTSITVPACVTVPKYTHSDYRQTAAPVTCKRCLALLGKNSELTEKQCNEKGMIQVTVKLQNGSPHLSQSECSSEHIMAHIRTLPEYLGYVIECWESCGWGCWISDIEEGKALLYKPDDDEYGE